MAGLKDVLQQLNVPVADLSQEDPRGRLDVLASRLLAHGVRSFVPLELHGAYHMARPLIDGQIAKFLGAFRVPVAGKEDV